MKTPLFSAIFLSLLLNFCYGSVIITPKAPLQGSTFTVVISEEENYRNATGTFTGAKFPFYMTEKGLRAIIGISATAKTGLNQLEITATDEAGNTKMISKKIRTRPARFHAEKLYFVATKKEKATPVKIRSDQDELNDVITRETGAQLWSGKFLAPVKGRITSAYGSYRLYNGKRLGDHRGTDIGGNPAGTLIKAANSGFVVFAKLLPAFGSVVVLDHGQGIHSIYMHMSKRLVEPGQKVEKGQFIGRVGSTGISTGPHLHFGLSVHGIRVDAMEWVRRAVAK